MILNCFTINYFFLDFGNGYCVEMPSDKKDLDKITGFIFFLKRLNGNFTPHLQEENGFMEYI